MEFKMKRQSKFHESVILTKEADEMKTLCVCGHIIENEDDQRLHTLLHALSYGFTLTAEEKDLLAA
jgi:hypothetical protein